MSTASNSLCRGFKKELTIAHAVNQDHAGLVGKKKPTTGLLYRDLTPASQNLASASHQKEGANIPLQTEITDCST